MYKKSALLSTLLCMVTPCTAAVKPWLEVKPSYFIFVTSPMKKIYNNGGFEMQGSVSVPLCSYFDLYGSIGYRKVAGHALNTGTKTNLNIMPVDIGLKPLFNVSERFCYFFAVGPRYFHFHQHNDSPYIDCSIKGGSIGLFINTGFNILLADRCLLGIFGEYSYEKKTVYPKRPNVYSNGSVQMGGIACGLSLGYAF